MNIKRLMRVTVLTLLCSILAPLGAAAQPGGPPTGQVIDTPAPLAAARAKYENMTVEQLRAAGFEVPPVQACVGSPFGGMGIHATHWGTFQAQVNSGIMDPANPPIVLLDANMRVVGLEWETTTNTPQPTFLGMPVPLQPGHPGMEEPHYMVHIYFRPNNQVLAGAVFDPQVFCPQAAGGGEGAGGAGGAPGMPRTGGAPIDLLAWLAIGSLLLGAGIVVRRRTVQAH